MIIVSDMMGTLTTGSPFLGLVDWVKHNQSKRRAQFYLAAIAPSYYLARKGIIDWQKWGQNLMVKSLGYIQGANQEKLYQASEWVVEHDLWRKRREDMVARLIDHRTHGAQIYIASTVVEPFIEPFAKRIGGHGFGTPVEIVNGKVRIVGELMTNERKIEQVLSRLGVDRVDIAYGDTDADIPLLEHSGHPVAVYPNNKLKDIALLRGWEIFDNRSISPQV